MKTKNLFFMVGLLILGGISIGNAQVALGTNDNTVFRDILPSPSPGIGNVLLGSGAGELFPNTTVEQSEADGKNVQNVFVGINAGKNSNGVGIDGENARNTFLGFSAGFNNTSGSDNVFIGRYAGFANTTGNKNVMIKTFRQFLTGQATLRASGSDNTMVGFQTGDFLTSGAGNCFFGSSSGQYTSSGNNNTFLGGSSGINNTLGSNNISLGTAGPTGSANFNVLMGIGAAPDCTGNNNIVISSHQPNPSGSNTSLTSGSNNLFLGRVILNNSQTTANVLGNNSSNSIILANGDGAQRLIISGTNGFAGFGMLNNAIPSNTLEIQSGADGVNGTSGLRLTNLRSSNNAVPNPSAIPKVLTVDANGDVILVNDAVGTTTTSNAWNLAGNDLTTAPNSFLGSTTNHDLVFRRNNIRSGLLQAPGATPPGTRFMSVGNTAFGVSALSSALLTGGSNSAMGVSSLLNNTNGIGNVAVGTNSLMNSQTGIGNVAFGYNALGSLTDHTTFGGWLSNTAIGTFAGSRLVNGNGNVFIGLDAGSATGTAYNNLLYIDSDVNVTNRGNNTPLIFGDFFNRNLTFNLNNENGAPNLTSRVTINSGGTDLSGLRFADLNSGFIPAVSNTKFLTVNGAGDVVLENIAYTGAACNLYSCDGEIVTTLAGTSNNPISGLRTVTMGENNLFFRTNGTFDNKKPGSGRIYIGTNINFPLLNNIAPLNDTNQNISQYRLLVEGGILSEQMKVALRSGVDWKDNVFATDYKLMPLQEIASFVNTNKHLPGIESAEELVKNGLDLGAMQAKQMGKIEELTLYAIEQDKKLELQGKEIEELKTLVKTLLEKK